MQLSIIVCTRNRAYAIAACLDSIAVALSHASPVDAEIVVVDNASEDDTSAVVTTWATSCAFPVRLLQERRKGLAVARNCGIRAAQGDLLVFTDDDCRLSLDFIRDAVRHDEADGSQLVIRGGRIDLGDPTDLPLTIKTETERARWHINAPCKQHELLGGKAISGCNMVMRREAVQTIGFFDERLGAGSPIPSAEDVDWCLRGYFAGIAVEYVPDMAIAHFHGRKTPQDANKLMSGYLAGTGALYAKYIFKDHRFCHEFYWDFKKAAQELLLRRNKFVPEWGFSYRDKVKYSLLGAMKYVLLWARHPL